MDLRKTLTDAGYIGVGLGVLGYQQAASRGREVREQLGSGGRCLADQLRDLRGRVEQGPTTISARAADARGRAESLVDQVRDTLGELPQQVVRTVEPVTERVRALVSPAA